MRQKRHKLLLQSIYPLHTEKSNRKFPINYIPNMSNNICNRLHRNNINTISTNKKNLGSLLVNNKDKTNDINCALFVETKTKPEDNVQYRDWSIIRHDSNIVNHNSSGDSLAQIHPSLGMKKRNALRINHPLNDALHFMIPFRNDEVHPFLIYNHPTSFLEEAILNMAVNYKFSLIIGDFNINNSRKRRNLNNFLQKSNFHMAETPPTSIMPNNEDTTPDSIVYSSHMRYLIQNVDVIPGLGSDHSSIILNLDMNINLKAADRSVYCFQKSKMESINQS
ncbi:hypothetical protein HHI36_020153 [Cryptolaemus montrouzieri]|uniref:Endonuclease/exonuclease/phosphatase domain-containing protein n=1 Tax=Cryptolaemus montrouzieri TaxID=559131 RepID=A0ABD2NAM9_9CUCU